MRLTDEIHFRFLPNFESKNINLDPTRRYGSETMASLRVNERLRFKGGVAYTRAVFREGPLAGNDVPLVSTWTGSAGRFLGHAAAMADLRRRGALYRQPAHGQRPSQSSAADSRRTTSSMSDWAARSSGSSGRSRCRTCSTSTISTTRSRAHSRSGSTARSASTTPIRSLAGPICCRAGVKLPYRRWRPPRGAWPLAASESAATSPAPPRSPCRS